MTKTLFLLRHAKAEPSHPYGDKARPLSDRGRADAAALAPLLAGRGISYILCSSSVRTRETLDQLDLPGVHTEYMDALYLASEQVIAQRISEIPDEAEAVLVVGHAPGIPVLSSQLAWESQPAQADNMRCWFPTSGLAQFSIEGSWSGLASGDVRARLVEINRR